MPATSFDRILQNDGEGIDHVDMNDAAEIGAAGTFEWLATMLAGRLTAEGFSSNPSGSYLRTVGADPRPAGSMAIETNGGFLLLDPQRAPGAGAVDFASSGLSKLPIYVPTNSSEITSAVPAADATNPRWDSIFLKIDTVEDTSVTRDFEDATTGNKTSQTFTKLRRTRVTKSYQTGTPAGSPTKPSAPDATYIRWADLYVPATFSGTIGTGASKLYAHAYPLGPMQTLVVPAARFIVPNNAHWPIDDEGVRTSGGASEVAYAICPVASPLARLVRIGGSALLTLGSLDIVRRDVSAGSDSETLVSGASLGQTAANWSAPVWCNGYTAPALLTAVSDELLVLKFTSGGAGNKLRHIVFTTIG